MRTVALGELVRPAGTRAGTDSELPVYSVTKHAGFVPSLEYFKKQVFSRDLRDYRLVEPGDFAYATIHLDEGSIGIAPERSLISPMYTVFRADASQVDCEYLVRFLKSPRALAQYPQLGKGAVHRRKAISLNALTQVPIPLPSLPEQRRIAAILDQADALRAKRRQFLIVLADVSASAFQAAFVTRPHDRVEFGSLIVDGPKNGLYRPMTDYGAGTPIVRIDSFRLGAGRLDPARLKRLRATSAERREYDLQEGDIVVNRVNAVPHVGKAALVSGLSEPTVFESNMMRVRLDRDRVLPDYAIAYLQSPDARRQIAPRVKRAVNQASINQSDLRALSMPLPPLDLQREFAARVAAIDAQRTAAELSLQKLDELFASLQARAFSGRL